MSSTSNLLAIHVHSFYVSCYEGNDIGSATKIYGIFRSKLCQKSFACHSPPSVYPTTN